MNKKDRKQFEENQRLIDQMNSGTKQDSNTDVHSQINTAMDAFAAADEELKRKNSIRKKFSGR